MKTLTTMFTCAAMVATGAALAQTAEAPLTVDAVLTRFAAAVGGRDALTRVDRRFYDGMIVQDLSWTEPRHQETPFLATADAGGLVRYAEADAWSDLPDTVATGLDTKLRWILHPHFALRVEEFFPHLSVSGREIREGRPVVVLAPRDLRFAHYALCFDEESGLLTHVGYYVRLEDWREEDGVLYPHRWVFSRKGGHTTYVVAEMGTGPAPGP